MPWRRFASITLSQAVVVTEQSGDTVYCIPFSWLDDNFNYLKNRIYIGNGAPVINPEQDKAWYIDKLNQILYWWDNENNRWEVLLNVEFFIGSGSPNIIPSKDKALYIDRTNNILYWWDSTTNQWKIFSVILADTVDGFHASLTPQANTILPLDADAKFPNSVFTNQIREFENPIDLSNATQDYFLQIGEVAKIEFFDVTSKALRIMTQNNTFYQFTLIPYATGGNSDGGTTGIWLYPNNTTYENEFSYVEIFRTQAELGSNVFTYSSFRIGSAFNVAICYITNRTVYKNMIGIRTVYGVSNSWPAIAFYSTDWRNTTTSWTSLGTVVFPQNTSGVIYVRRLM